MTEPLLEECRQTMTVAQAVNYWLENRRNEVKKNTWTSYRRISIYILGPLLVGTRGERHTFTRTGNVPAGAKFVDMLGPTRIAELTTAGIRIWHKTLTAQVSTYTANAAKKFLRAVLALAAEDFHVTLPPMPSRLGRGRPKTKKTILTPEQIGHLLSAAVQDEEKGIYYAFPFLTGMRISEQLALLWSDIDFAANIVRISRMQELDGTITPFTKTAAGTRDIPMSPLLRSMLMTWKMKCPLTVDPPRVFPALGGGRSHAKKAIPLSYANFLQRYWRHPLRALGLPVVTPHSARHAFISTLQAEGVEVGLVAKLAGHASITVTLSHYTQAVRGGATAVEALEKRYCLYGRLNHRELVVPGVVVVNRPTST